MNSGNDPVAIRLPLALIELSRESVEAIADAIAARLENGLGRDDRSPWLYGQRAAAEYMGWPVRRVQRFMSAIPHHREGDGGRISFHRDELDAFLAEFGSGT